MEGVEPTAQTCENPPYVLLTTAEGHSRFPGGDFSSTLAMAVSWNHDQRSFLIQMSLCGERSRYLYSKMCCTGEWRSLWTEAEFDCCFRIVKPHGCSCWACQTGLGAHLLLLFCKCDNWLVSSPNQQSEIVILMTLLFIDIVIDIVIPILNTQLW